MNFNNFTIKSQEAMQRAQQIAQGLNQQQIENAHILQGIIEVDENVIPFILNKLGVNSSIFKETLNRILEGFPKVSGAELMLSRTTNETLLNASTIAKKMKDEYVAIEHLLLAIIKSKGDAAQLLKDNGINENDLKKAISALRQGSKVDSQTAEETYNALNKYAKNLNQLASDGKLDPVIGRDEEIRRILQIFIKTYKKQSDSSWRTRHW